MASAPDNQLVKGLHILATQTGIDIPIFNPDSGQPAAEFSDTEIVHRALLGARPSTITPNQVRASADRLGSVAVAQILVSDKNLHTPQIVFAACNNGWLKSDPETLKTLLAGKVPAQAVANLPTRHTAIPKLVATLTDDDSPDVLDFLTELNTASWADPELGSLAAIALLRHRPLELRELCALQHITAHHFGSWIRGEFPLNLPDEHKAGVWARVLGREHNDSAVSYATNDLWATCHADRIIWLLPALNTFPGLPQELRLGLSELVVDTRPNPRLQILLRTAAYTFGDDQALWQTFIGESKVFDDTKQSFVSAAQLYHKRWSQAAQRVAAKLTPAEA